MTHKCKSGRHVWTRQEDAAKCCNGYRRVLILGDTAKADRIAGEPLPGGVLYGFAWAKGGELAPTGGDPQGEADR